MVLRLLYFDMSRDRKQFLEKVVFLAPHFLKHMYIKLVEVNVN